MLCFCVIYVALLLQKLLERRVLMGTILIFLWLDLVSCFLVPPDRRFLIVILILTFLECLLGILLLSRSVEFIFYHF